MEHSQFALENVRTDLGGSNIIDSEVQLQFRLFSPGEAEEAGLKFSTSPGSPQPRPPQGSLRARTDQVSSHGCPFKPLETLAPCLSDPKFPISVHQSSGPSGT